MDSSPHCWPLASLIEERKTTTLEEPFPNVHKRITPASRCFFVAFRPAQCQTFRYALHTRLPLAFFWPPFDLAPLPKTLLHRPCRPCLGAFGLVEQFQSIQFSIPTISRSSTASRIVEPQQRQPATIHCASAGYSAKANDPRDPIPTANFVKITICLFHFNLPKLRNSRKNGQDVKLLGSSLLTFSKRKTQFRIDVGFRSFLSRCAFEHG